jgi:predicted  nucleic acid-binding Zn-ribbon protein
MIKVNLILDTINPYMNLLRVVLFSSALLILFVSCQKKHIEKLETQNDSLRTVLRINEQAVLTIKEINTLLDSIDAERKLIKLEMVEGIPYSNYSARMEGVLEYVKKSQTKIDDLQKTLKSVKNENSAYTMMIDALKNELEIATSEISSLQEQVKNVENKNTELVTLVHLQQNEISANQTKIESSKQELSLFENKIHELMLQSKVSEADAYYARAEAVYEAAQRTKLAPRKKKETLKEALELYKKSFSLGKAEARAKVTVLQKKI